MNLPPLSSMTPERMRLYVAGLWNLRQSDVWLASFPRSGSTWLRNLFFNLYQTLSGHPLDQSSLIALDTVMPSLGAPNLLRDWPYPALPRIVKTHQPYRRLLFAKPGRVLYILRDPRDITVTYFHYRQSHLKAPFQGTFSDFLREPRYGLRAVFRHYRSWRPYATTIIRYEQLLEDTPAEFSKLLVGLGIEAAQTAVDEAVSWSSFEVMHKAEESGGMLYSGRFESGFRAVRKGLASQWHEYFSSSDLDFFHRLCDDYDFHPD